MNRVKCGCIMIVGPSSSDDKTGNTTKKRETAIRRCATHFKGYSSHEEAAGIFENCAADWVNATDNTVELCPKCHSEDIDIKSLLAIIGKPQSTNYNKVACKQCGWSGILSDLETAPKGVDGL